MSATLTLSRRPVRPALDPARLVYVRRRIAAAVVMIIMIVGAWTVGGAVVAVFAPTGAGADPTPAEPAVHVVMPGDTMWSIAAGLVEAGDVRAVVDRLVAQNGGSQLEVGQRLVIG